MGREGVGVVCSHSNYIASYEECQGNRDSDFHYFMCSLFPSNLYIFYLYIFMDTYGKKIKCRKS